MNWADTQVCPYKLMLPRLRKRAVGLTVEISRLLLGGLGICCYFCIEVTFCI